MDEQLVGTLNYDNYKADVYSSSVPGEFKIIYRDPAGRELEQSPMTGISTYHQREHEILEHLHQLSHGVPPGQPPDLEDSGEY